MDDDPWSSCPLSSPFFFFSTTSDSGASSFPEFDFGAKFKSGSAAGCGALSGELAPKPEEEERPGLEDDSAAVGSTVEAGGGADETRLTADGLICCVLRWNEEGKLR